MDTETQLETEPVDQQEQHSEHDEKAFLSSLSDEQDFDPSAVQAEPQTNKADIEAAAGMVCIGLMTVEQTLKAAVHKDFTFDPDQSENVAYKVAPLIVKYGGNPPPWLAQYMDEIMALFAVGALMLSSCMQVKHIKKAELEALAKKEAANDETTNVEAA